VKKLISIGVAIALLTMVVVPVGVAAQDVEDPGTYSKTPFGILGSGIQLIGELFGDLQPIISEVAELPIDLADLTPILDKVGAWTAIDLAWMTDMTAWSMVTMGDVVSTVLGVPFIADQMGETDLGGIEDIFYVLSARLWDPWGEYGGVAVLPDVIVDAFPPGL
jgi:hypothetical protein